MTVPKGKNVGRIEKLNKQNSDDAHAAKVKELLSQEVYLKRLYYLILEIPDPEQVGPDCTVKYIEKPVLHKGKLVVGTMEQMVRRYGSALRGYKMHRFDHRWLKS